MDGKPAEILRANIVVRAVRLEAGPHEVIFEYRPAMLWAGAAVSGPAWLLALAFMVWPRRLAPPDSPG